MSEYVPFARKYRPRTFSDVVGQEAIARALRGAVQSGRTTSVYLFSGSHGVGKTSMARILAKALNCPESNEGDPCLTCPVCVSIDRGEAIDVLEIDAASNRKIEDARQIREGVRYRAQGLRYKVYILDEVHQFTKEAFDALLKTFEEAPDHVRLILATTELRKVPSTIRSRSQVFHFRRNSRADIETRLKKIVELEGVTLSEDALGMISRRARGSMRDAQKMLDQVVTLGSKAGVELGALDVARLLGAFTPERVNGLLLGLANGDPAGLLGEIGTYFAEGGYAGTFLEELQDAMRAVLYLKTCGEKSSLLEEANYAHSSLKAVAEAMSEEGILYTLQLLAEVEQKLRIAKPREPRVLIEVALVRLARARDLRPIGEVLARLERLEEAVTSGAGVGSDPSVRRREGAGAADQQQRAPQQQQQRAPQQQQQRAPQQQQQRAPQQQQQQQRAPQQQQQRAPQHQQQQQRAPQQQQRAPQQQQQQQRAPQHQQQQRAPQHQQQQQQPALQQQRQRRPGSYSYPAEIGPGGGGATPPDRAPSRPREPARASAPTEKRAMAEADRSARLDAAPGTSPALTPLNPAAVLNVWQTMRSRLSDSDKLGMAAEVLERGDPQLRLDPDGIIRIRVGLKGMWWDRINEPRNCDRLSELFAERLGAPAPIELERVDPVQKAEEVVVEGVLPVRDEPLVKLAQRELDARQL